MNKITKINPLQARLRDLDKEGSPMRQAMDMEMQNKKMAIIPISKIMPNPDQPRKHFTNIEPLAKSIMREGLLSPLVIAERADCFMLVDGERRYRAMGLINDWIQNGKIKEEESKTSPESIPCYIKLDENAASIDMQIQSYLANEDREDITEAERSLFLLNLQTEFKMSLGNLSDRTGKTKSTLCHVIKPAKNLSPELMNLAMRYQMSGSQLAKLARLVARTANDLKYPLQEKLHEHIMTTMKSSEEQSHHKISASQLTQAIKNAVEEILPCTEKTHQGQSPRNENFDGVSLEWKKQKDGMISFSITGLMEDKVNEFLAYMKWLASEQIKLSKDQTQQK